MKSVLVRHMLPAVLATAAMLSSAQAADPVHLITREEAGLPAEALPTCLDEAEATREALQWARPGDLLVLPIHEPARRDVVVALLDRLRDAGWRAGQRLPED